MPLYKDIYYADNSTALSIANISAAEATSTGDAIEALKLKTAVPVADAAARNALFTSPVQGNAVWRNDRGWEERYYALYNSSTNPGGAPAAGWYPVNSIAATVYARSASNRDAIITSPKQGMSAFNNATGCMETYYELYNSSTNPGGASVAGWYPVQGNLPKLSVITSTAQTLTSTAAAITFGGTLTQDIENNISFNKSTGTVTINQPGMYRVTGMFTVNATTSGSKVINIYKNGAGVLSQVVTTAVITPMEISTVLKLVSTDTINIYGSANVSTTTVVSGATYYTYMSVEYMGPGY